MDKSPHVLTGFNDNASGTAAVLELARALATARCRPKFSIVLVLFDLEEYGTQGSMAFVQDFLVPSVLRKMGFPGVMGAYILDSIMAFNNTAGSQVNYVQCSGHERQMNETGTD